MATIYWYGGTGNWNDGVTHWSLSSGNSGGTTTTVPTSSDNVIFDANSFGSNGQSVTLSGPNSYANELNFSGITYNVTFALASGRIDITGNVTLSSKLTFTCVDSNIVVGGNSIWTSNSSIIKSTYFGILNNFTLGDDFNLISTDGFNLARDASLYTNNYNLTVSSRFFIGSYYPSNSKMIMLGTSTITVGTSFDLSQQVGPLTMSTSNSTIIYNSSSLSGNLIFTGKDQTYGNVILKSGNGYTTTITGANTFKNLTLSRTTGMSTYSFPASTTNFINNLIIQSGDTVDNLNSIVSSVVGTRTTLNVGSITGATYQSFRDINLTNTYDSTSYITSDLGNNVNIIFGNQNRYWVSSIDALWDSTAGTKWASSSSGVTYMPVPSVNDIVYFDNGSTTNCTGILANVYCKDLNFTNYTKTFTHTTNNNINIYGNLKMFSGMTYTFTYSSSLTFLATSIGKTITGNGKNLPTIYFNGVGGEWVLQDNTNIIRIILTNGSFVTNGKNIIVEYLVSASGGSLDISGSTITLNGIYSTTTWVLSSITNFISNYSTLSFINQYGQNVYFGNGYVYNNVIFNNIGLSYLYGNSTFSNLTSLNSNLTLNDNITINDTLYISGATTRNLIYSNTISTQRNITCNGHIILENCDIRDIKLLGSSSPLDVSTLEVGDCGGNENILFRVGENRYWHLGTGNFHDNSKWYSETNGGGVLKGMPLPQDCAIFDSNSFDTTGEITIVNTRIGSFDMTGVNKAVTLTTQYPIQFEIYGNFILGNSIFNNNFSNFNFYGRSYETSYINIPFPNLKFGYYITFIRNTYSLLNNLIGSRYGITINPIATLNLNSFEASCGYLFVVNGTLNAGSGTIGIHGIYDALPGSLTGSGTINAGTSTVKIYKNINSASINCGNRQFYNLWITGSTPTTSIYGSCTFNNIRIEAGRTVKFEDGKTTTILNTLTSTGTPSSPITISSIAGSQHTLYSNAGIIYTDYLNLSYSIASGTTFYAGTHSTNSGNNTNWVFNDPYMPISSGDWNTGSTWNKGIVPTLSDNVYLNNYDITISTPSYSKVLMFGSGSTSSLNINSDLTLYGNLSILGGSINNNSRINMISQNSTFYSSNPLPTNKINVLINEKSSFSTLSTVLDDLTINAPSGGTYYFYNPVTATTITLNGGNNRNLLNVQSFYSNTQMQIIKTGITLNYVSFKDTCILPYPPLSSGITLLDRGNNSGISFGSYDLPTWHGSNSNIVFTRITNDGISTNNSLEFIQNPGNGYIYTDLSLPLIIGEVWKLSFYAKQTSGLTSTIKINDWNDNIYTNITSNWTKYDIAYASNVTGLTIGFNFINTGSTNVMQITDISFAKILGNHLTQTNTNKQPKLAMKERKSPQLVTNGGIQGTILSSFPDLYGLANSWLLGPSGYTLPATIVNSDNGLILWVDAWIPQSYPYSGSTWYDISGNNNHLILNGTNYNFDNGNFYFNGNNDNMYSTINFGANPIGVSCSIGIWFRTSVASGTKLISLENTQTGTTSTISDRQIWMGSDGKIYYGVYDSIQRYVTSTNVLNDNQWHYIVCVTPGNNQLLLYVDGVLNNSSVGMGYSSYPSSYIRVGSYFNNYPNGLNGFFTGYISSIQIYKRPISSTEIVNYYNNTRNRILTFTPFTSGTTYVQGVTQGVDVSATITTGNGFMNKAQRITILSVSNFTGYTIYSADNIFTTGNNYNINFKYRSNSVNNNLNLYTNNYGNSGITVYNSGWWLPNNTGTTTTICTNWTAIYNGNLTFYLSGATVGDWFEIGDISVEQVFEENGVAFDGIDDFMSTMVTGLTSPVTIYTILKQSNWITESYIMDGGVDNLYSLNMRQSGTTEPNVNILTDVSNTNSSMGQFELWTIGISGNSSFFDISGHRTNFTGDTIMDGFTLGHNIKTPSKFTVKEIIIRYGLDDNQTQTLFKSYFGSKYGVYYKPTVEFITVSASTSNSIYAEYNVTDDGGTNVTSRGICWGSSPYPTIDDYLFHIDGTGTGNFNTTFNILTGSSSFYMYHFRAYAINSMGVSYSQNYSVINLLPFQSLVSPIGFDKTAQPVDIHNIYSDYYSTNKDALYIYSTIDTLLDQFTLTPNSTTYYRYGYSISGVSYTVDLPVNGPTVTPFNETISTKRWVLVADTRRITTDALIRQNGDVWSMYVGVWLYCGSLINTFRAGNSGSGLSSLKYVHCQNIDSMTSFGYCATWGSPLTGKINLGNYVTVVQRGCFNGSGKSITGELKLPNSLIDLSSYSTGPSDWNFPTTLTGLILNNKPTISQIAVNNKVSFTLLQTLSVDSTNPSHSSISNCNILFDKYQNNIIWIAQKAIGDLVIPNTISQTVLTNLGTQLSGVNTFDGYLFIGSQITDITNLYVSLKTFNYITVDSGNTSYLTINGVLYNTGITNLIKAGKSNSGLLEIPSTIITINATAFTLCSNYSDLILPSQYDTSIYSHFDFSDFNGESLNNSILNLKNGTSGSPKSFYISSNSKNNLLAYNPNAITNASARYINVIG